MEEENVFVKAFDKLLVFTQHIAIDIVKGHCHIWFININIKDLPCITHLDTYRQKWRFNNVTLPETRSFTLLQISDVFTKIKMYC